MVLSWTSNKFSIGSWVGSRSRCTCPPCSNLKGTPGIDLDIGLDTDSDILLDIHAPD